MYTCYDNVLNRGDDASRRGASLSLKTKKSKIKGNEVFEFAWSLCLDWQMLSLRASQALN
jgi:hypothetical protein